MMTRIQTKLSALLTAALLMTGATAQAQEATENHLAYPYGFVGLQGGAQTTFTDYNNWKLITPTASVGVGGRSFCCFWHCLLLAGSLGRASWASTFHCLTCPSFPASRSCPTRSRR